MKQKKDRKKLLITIFIIFLMVSSTLGFILGYSSNEPEQETITYNNYEFFQHTTGRWVTYSGDNPIGLYTFPKDIENIVYPSLLSLNDINSANKVYITYDHNESLDLVLTEFSFLNQYMDRALIPSCTTDTPSCNNLPLKTCDSATDAEKIIQLNKANKTDSITYSGNCIILEGKDLLKPADRLIWTLLGVMNG